jgi:hypothetical protein
MKVSIAGLILSATFSLAALPGFAGQGYSSAASPQANEVSAGTRFLVGLRDTINTGTAKAGDHFNVRTLEPLALENGTILPPGVDLTGHIDKVTAAHKAGHARLWLTFDEIKTPNGKLPVVADVIDIPGVHSVKVDYDREGEIETRSGNRDDAMRAAAVGAFAGAGPGVVDHDSKEAAQGAAAGAATAFMATSGMGQEFVLEKGTKLELILDRPLYLARNY